MPTQAPKDGNGSLNPKRLPGFNSGSPTGSGSWKSSFHIVFLFITNKHREIWATPGKKGQRLSWPAASFILLQALVGLPLLPYALLRWHPQSELRFACFFVVALAASLLKVRLPGIEATMSPNFLFVLVGILDLSYPETLLMGCFGDWRSRFGTRNRGRG